VTAPKRILFIPKAGDPVEAAASILGADPEEYAHLSGKSAEGLQELVEELRKGREENDR
jgi:hypothetical protein